MNLQRFLRGIREYQILPARFTIIVGLAIVVGESLLAFAHLTGLFLTIALSFGLLMLSSFAGAVGINLIRNRTVPCYCFGSGDEEAISFRTLIRLLLVMAAECFLACFLWFGANSGSHAVQNHHSTQALLEALTWVAVILQLSLWSLSLPEVAALARRLYPPLRHTEQPSK